MSSERNRPLPSPVKEDAQSNSNAIRWHPKLTPYRFVTLLIGVVLAAAYNTIFAVKLKGSLVIHLILEWSSGIAVYGIVDWLRSYEKFRRDKDAQAKLWYYEDDIMEFIWRLCREISVEPPSYSTQELKSQGSNFLRPSVNNYHVLAFTSIVVFGGMRVTLNHWGFINAAAAVGWIFAGVVTPSLYIVGLYDCNPAHKFDGLFMVNGLITAHIIVSECSVIFFVALLAYIPFLCIPWLQYFMVFSYDKYFGGKPQESRSQFVLSVALLTGTSGLYALVAYYSLLPALLAVYILSIHSQPFRGSVQLIAAGMRKCGLKRFTIANEKIGEMFITIISTLRVANVIIHNMWKLVCCFSGGLYIMSQQMAISPNGILGGIITFLVGSVFIIIGVRLTSIFVFSGGMLLTVDSKHESGSFFMPRVLSTQPASVRARTG